MIYSQQSYNRLFVRKDKISQGMKIFVKKKGYYKNNNKLTAILKWCSPYSLAEGRSSSSEIKTIIPATAANNTPNTVALIKGMSIAKPINAPTGSDKPERKDNQKAFFLFPVA